MLYRIHHIRLVYFTEKKNSYFYSVPFSASQACKPFYWEHNLFSFLSIPSCSFLLHPVPHSIGGHPPGLIPWRILPSGSNSHLSWHLFDNAMSTEGSRMFLGKLSSTVHGCGQVRCQLAWHLLFLMLYQLRAVGCFWETELHISWLWVGVLLVQHEILLPLPTYTTSSCYHFYQVIQSEDWYFYQAIYTRYV